MKKTIIWIAVGVGLGVALITVAVMGIQKGVQAVSDQVQKDAEGDGVQPGQAEAAPPEGVPAEAVALMEKRLAFLEAINGIMSGGLADCPKMAEKIQAYTEQHQAEMEALDDQDRKLKRGMDAATRQAYEKWALGRMKRPLLRMVKLSALMVVKCPDEMATVERATSEFEHEP